MAGHTITFSCFLGNHTTDKKGYRLFWIHSSEKRKRDRKSRESALRKVEQALAELNSKLNKRNLKTRKQINNCFLFTKHTLLI